MSLSLPSTIIQSSPTPSATKVLAVIEGEEGEYQASLTETYQNMSEKTYKSLRRALPMTRSKMDWDKVFESSHHIVKWTDKRLGSGVQAWGRTIRWKRRLFMISLIFIVSVSIITRVELRLRVTLTRHTCHVRRPPHPNQRNLRPVPWFVPWDLSSMQSSSSTVKRSFTLKDKQKLLANLDIEGKVIAVRYVRTSRDPLPRS